MRSDQHYGFRDFYSLLQLSRFREASYVLFKAMAMLVLSTLELWLCWLYLRSTNLNYTYIK